MADKPRQFECVDDAMAAILRRKTEAERLRIASGMWKMARQIIWHTLRAEHPEWTEAELKRETARRMSRGAD